MMSILLLTKHSMNKSVLERAAGAQRASGLAQSHTKIHADLLPRSTLLLTALKFSLNHTTLDQDVGFLSPRAVSLCCFIASHPVTISRSISAPRPLC